MYFNSDNKQQFLEGERAGLQASAHFAQMAWSRAEANAQRVALSNDETAEAHSHAMKERFRVAHREAMAFEDDEDEEYGDMDEYGYAA